MTKTNSSSSNNTNNNGDDHEMDCDNDGYSSGEEQARRMQQGLASSDESIYERESDSDKIDSDDDEAEDEDRSQQNEGESNDSDDEENDNDEAASASDSDESVEEDENGELTKVIKQTYLPSAADANEDFEVDEKYYRLLYKATTSYPCMSFDILPDGLGEGEERANTFPASLSLVAGTYSGKKNSDQLMVIKFSKLNATKRSKQGDDEQDADTGDDDDTGKLKDYEGKMRHVSIPHNGCINRIRTTSIDNNLFTATWSESRAVHIWDISRAANAVKSDRQVSTFQGRKETPVYTFRGHASEGFAMNWSPVQPGLLATGDCMKFIYLHKPNQSGQWITSDSPLQGHSNSVEDIQWSPTEENIFASCSVDRAIRIWDIRINKSMVCIPNAHASDVNVISWNLLDTMFLVSGGDDHALKVWDMRQFGRATQSGQQPRPIATFAHHQAPITSVEWSSHDSTMFAAAGEDNQISIWDLSVEKDDLNESGKLNDQLKQLPPQLLFIHQGQKEIKELHWHRQMPGFIVSTAQSGIDIFKTINV